MLKEKLVDLLAAGAEFEYECEDCGEVFDERPEECPICGHAEFSRLRLA